jgi:hypothetical protein
MSGTGPYKFVDKVSTIQFFQHMILHIPDDVIRFKATMSELSCFAFENFNGKFKKNVVARRYPLKEFSNKHNQQVTCSFFPRNRGGSPGHFLIGDALVSPLGQWLYCI